MSYVVSIFRKSFKTFEFDLLLTRPLQVEMARVLASVSSFKTLSTNLTHAGNGDAQNSGTLAHAVEL